MAIGPGCARILQADGRAIVGGAVLLPGGRVGTAAHCVNLALGLARNSSDPKLDRTVQVDFPNSRSNKPLTAKVVGWTSPGADDIAVLQVIADMPGDVVVPQYDATASWTMGSPAWVRGYPGGDVRDTAISIRQGILRNRYAFYVHDDAEITVEPGYSGGPVYRTEGSRELVIGLTLSYRRGARTGKFSRIIDVLELSGRSRPEPTQASYQTVEDLQYFLRVLSRLLTGLQRNRREGLSESASDDVRNFLTILAAAFEDIEDQFTTENGDPVLVGSISARPSRCLSQFRDKFSDWNARSTEEERERVWRDLRQSCRRTKTSFNRIGRALVTGSEDLSTLQEARDKLAAIIQDHGTDYFDELDRM